MVLRDSAPWSGSVHALLRHLESVGFDGAPRVVGTGFDARGREVLTYIPGKFVDPGPWTLDGVAAVGKLLRDLHRASASFEPPSFAAWQPSYRRELGRAPRIIGHGDLGPWNIVARKGLPVAFIDWDFAGPVDPLVELALAAWLNARLHDDIVAEAEGLPPLDERAKHLRALLDGYELLPAARLGFVGLMIEVAINDAADEANRANITKATRSADTAPELVWALAWRSRGAAWMLRHRRILETALE